MDEGRISVKNWINGQHGLWVKVPVSMPYVSDSMIIHDLEHLVKSINLP